MFVENYKTLESEGNLSSEIDKNFFIFSLDSGSDKIEREKTKLFQAPH